MEISKAEFSTWMLALKACYPYFKPNDDDWRPMVERYHAELKGIDARAFTVSQGQILRNHPKFFPALGEVKDILEAKAKTYAASYVSTEPMRQLAAPKEPEVSTEKLAPSFIFSKLAEKWEMESRQLGLSGPTPATIAEQRFKEFWWTWKQVCK